MFVAVVQQVTPLARARLKVKRIGEIVGIYDDFVSLLLYDCDLSDLENITLKRKMYIESFRFYEIFDLEYEISKLKKEIKTDET